MRTDWKPGTLIYPLPAVLISCGTMEDGEAFRAASIAEIGMSTLQSRALAGMANRTAVFCMPGSTGACQTAWEYVLKDQLDSRTRPCNFYPHLTRETIG